jgi:putative endonuclease
LRDDSDDSQVEDASNAPGDLVAESREASKLQGRRTGIRGETYGYWYLRRHGYVFVARNYRPRGAKGKIDLVGYNGDTLALVEVRTRTVRDDALPDLPELSVTTDKQRVVVRTARRFLSERHVGDCPCCFDVLAIDNRRGCRRRCACTRMRSAGRRRARADLRFVHTTSLKLHLEPYPLTTKGAAPWSRENRRRSIRDAGRRGTIC